MLFDCKWLIVYDLFFFMIVDVRKHTKTNELHIFYTFEIENVGQVTEDKNFYLLWSITNDGICFADFFFIILASSNIQKKNEFSIFIILAFQ